MTYAAGPMGADHTAGLVVNPGLGPDEYAQASQECQIVNMVCDSSGFCQFISPTLTLMANYYSLLYGEDVTPEQLGDQGWECLEDEWKFNAAAGWKDEDNGLSECLVEEGIGPDNAMKFDVSLDIINRRRSASRRARALHGALRRCPRLGLESAAAARRRFDGQGVMLPARLPFGSPDDGFEDSEIGEARRSHARVRGTGRRRRGRRVPGRARACAPLESRSRSSIASGRVLAEDVTAAVDVPGFPRSAMDGYAMRGEESFGASAYDPIRLDVVGSLALPGKAVRTRRCSRGRRCAS